MANPLTEVLPANVRRYFYAILWVAGVVFASVQAFDGDWLAVAAGVVTALGGGVAQSNTPKRKV